MENPDDSRTIDEFCVDKNISRPSYFKIRRLGLGPEELRIPGTSIVRITRRAAEEWEERMARLSLEDAAKHERQRRKEHARRAGQAAAKSPAHVANRRRREKQST
jgi:hypothetical protein